MRVAPLACALVIVLSSAPAIAADNPAQADSRLADRSERLRLGLALAKIAQPEELVVSTALNQLDGGLINSMRSDPSLAKLEAQYPGFLGRYYAAARPELEKTLRARLPQLWKAMASAYADEMTAPEMNSYARFLGGPVGQKIQRLASKNFDGSALMQAGVKSGLQKHDAEQDSGQKELLAASSMAMLSTLATLSDAERSKFVDFMGSPAGKAGQRAGKGVTAAVVAWMNADDPQAGARMGEIAVGVLTKMKSEKGTH
jgi:hypothetical protein